MQGLERGAALWGMMVVLLIGCAEQRMARRVEQHIALRQPPPYVESALRHHQVVPGMTLDDVRAAIGTPLSLPRTGPHYGLAFAEAYRVRQYGRIDTVWAFFDRDSTVVLIER